MTKKHSMGALLPVTVGLVVSGSVHAGAIFSQTPDQVTAYLNDMQQPQFLNADDFSVGSATTIDSIGFWGAYNAGPPTSETFTVTIYADALGTPGTALLTTSLVDLTRTATGASIAGLFPEYRYDADLTTVFSADAGTTYHVGIVADTTSSPLTSWFWSTAGNSAGAVGSSLSTDEGNSWSPTFPEDDLAFELYSVPAPATLALLGLAGLCGGRRRRA